MSRHKIAHITTVDLSLRYLLLRQLCALKEAGYDVTGISAPGENASALEAQGIRHLSAPLTRRITPLTDLVALWRLYRLLQQEQFVIVHTHTPKANLLGQIAAYLARVPIRVYTAHGFYFHANMHPLKRRFYITLEKISARCADLVFLINSEDVNTAITEKICPVEKIRRLDGIGIDLQHYDPARLSPQDITRKRREIGLPDGARVVGFVGRLVREKGLLELFAAARIVRERMPDVRFLFVGPVDTQKPDALTPDTAEEYGLADICHFLGMRQDMPELYALMDVFVLPSHREGFGLVLAEAGAMGVPVIATDIRGCREVVEHGRNGLLVPFGDIQSLADAILELLTNHEKARRMGEEGHCIALERFDERVVFEKVKAEYARLLREKGLAVPELLGG